MQQISENIYVETGFGGCNTGFVVTDEGVVLIDTPETPADAKIVQDEIAKHGPIRYVIITEPHADHFTGNFFFEGTIIGHEATSRAILGTTVKEMEERLKRAAPDLLPLPDGFRLIPPEITFSERLTFQLGNHTFQLITMPGHTPYEAAVYIPEEKVVFTSDNIFCRVQTWLRDAQPYDILDSLKRIDELDADVLVPGHGSVCDKSYIPEMAGIVKGWIDAVTASIEKGLSMEEALETRIFNDPYPLENGNERLSQMVYRMNVNRLYEVLGD